MTDFFANFLNPEKRLFIGYLISAAFIAIVWLRMVQKKPLINIVSGFFDSKIWFSRSAIADYKLMLINQFFVKLLAPILIGQLALTIFIFENMHLFFSRPSESFPVWMVMLIFTTVLLVVDDFSRYLLHRLMHRVPLLWRFHKAHHSATNLTPMTVFRTHPLEGLVFTLRSAITQGFVISTFVYFFGEGVDLYTILGANLFIFLFNVFGSNLRHSHIGIRYWKWLEYILISPAQHHLHHSISKRHYNKNYGATLAIWDWLFSSLHHSEETEI